MQQEARSTLDVIYENWQALNEKLQTRVAPLTNEQLMLQPAPGMWPVGQILQHVVSVRAGWFSGTLQDPDPEMAKYTMWGQRDSPDRSAGEQLRGLAQTWDFIESRIHRWTPADCAQTFPDESDGVTYHVSRSWVIYHVMEHDIYHCSEVSLILGMNGLQSLGI